MIDNLNWLNLEEFDVPVAQSESNQKLIYSKKVEFIAIIYKHIGNIRRTIYLTLDGNLISKESPDALLSMLPGLDKYIETIYQKSINCMFSTEKLLGITQYTRGSQSFAFGHFIMDILPILFYRSCLRRNGKSPPLLLYKEEQWQINLMRACAIERNQLVYYNDLVPFYSNPLVDCYKIKGVIVKLRKENYVIKSMQRTFEQASKNNLSDKITKKILFLSRKNIKARVDRWANAESCIHKLQRKSHVSELNPSSADLNTIIAQIKIHELTVTAAGSAAYNSLIFGQEQHFTLMIVPYKVDSPETWKYTLRMFKALSKKLILVSNKNGFQPSSSGWDNNIEIDENEFVEVTMEVLKYIETIDARNLNDKRKIMYFKTICMNLPCS